MDQSVKNFFAKNAADGYAAQYRTDHSPRIKGMLEHFGLNGIKNQKVLDIGGGMGFLGELIDPSNEYWVIDGAQISSSQKLCSGYWVEADLDRSSFGSEDGDNSLIRSKSYPWDVAFCCETLEHLGAPINCLIETKKLVKQNGDIYISIPTEQMWHNAPYPGLLWPVQNFEQFLGQLALPILDRWTWSGGWPSYMFRCRNAGYEEKVMLFPKHEGKFLYANPIEMTNL